MIFSIIIGIMVGILSFLPLYFAFRMSKKVTQTSSLGNGALMILGTVISFAILITFVLIFYFCFRNMLVPYTLSVAITLIVVSVGFGAYSVYGRNKTANERKTRAEKDINQKSGKNIDSNQPESEEKKTIQF